MKYAIILAVLFGAGCSPGGPDAGPAAGDIDAHGHASDDRAAKGPHGGRLLGDRDFQIELTIFESGVEPQFRAYAYADERPVPPGEVSLSVELMRLGGQIDVFAFAPREDYLLGDGVVTEPHSFTVSVTATRAGATRNWSYDSFEGRTRIDAEMAAASGIATEIAGPALLREILLLHGTVVPDPQRVFVLHARFPGVIREVRKRIGDRVQAGETVAVIESNESLQRYNLTAPAAGIVVSRTSNPGIAIDEQPVMTIADLSTVWVELAAFQHDATRVQPGQEVVVRDVDGHQAETGKVDSIAPIGSAASQSLTVRISLPNDAGRWRPGLFVTGEIAVAEYEVPIALRRDALQSFRDWDVVFEQVGDEYEVRPLQLGRADGARVEVLDGIAPGASYVTTGSYVIKADIEKSGATHDH